MDRKWWKEAVVYQIYPRSFYDTNADGIGDLQGVIQKIGYLKDLGVSAVWLNPIFVSPNDDMGYDISDYYGIMAEFGTMADFGELLAKLHENGIKLILDLVFNHTSDEHAWFVESRSSKDSEKRDFYIWRDGAGGKEPNNWASFFTQSAWKYDAKTGQYYLHLFSEKQPDLNWRNENVRKEIYRMMNWWLDKGVDGFRLDVVNLLVKAEGLPDSGKKPTRLGYVFDETMFANLPETHECLKQMHKEVFRGKDVVAIGETPFVTSGIAREYVDEASKELDIVFSFELMDIDSGKSGKWEIVDYDLKKLKSIINDYQLTLKDCWNSLFWSNHDQPRAVSRFGDDRQYRVRSAKMLATVMHMLKGTPFIYQGEEIGMTNMPFSGPDDLRDIESLEFYREAIKAGLSPEEALAPILKKGRDNARTPMQWDDSEHAGFTKGEPWQRVNPNYREINVSACMADGDSIYHYYRELIRLRRENHVVVYGEYRPLMEDHGSVIAYLRKYRDITWLVIANFYGEETSAELPFGLRIVKTILSNMREENIPRGSSVKLAPYAAYVFSVEENRRH